MAIKGNLQLRCDFLRSTPPAFFGPPEAFMRFLVIFLAIALLAGVLVEALASRQLYRGLIVARWRAAREKERE